MPRVPSQIKPIGSILAEAGYRCYLVGGAVRDMLAGRPVTDLDLATDAEPQEVMRLFRRVIPTGIDHGTVTILFKGQQYETTTFRTESNYSDGRRPDTVAFAPAIEDDLARRDFTVNGMAIDVQTGTLVDPFRGAGDIRRQIVRAIGDPHERFSEDSLRVLRAIRFSVQLEFSIEERTYAAIRQCSAGIVRVSVERIRDELLKMLQARDAARAFRLMRETDLLQYVLPELLEGIDVPQDSEVAPDVFEHLLLSTNGAAPERTDIRVAALLHDIAKPRTRVEDEDGAVHFYGHDEQSARMTAEILSRLRLPKREIEHVTHLIRHHMFSYSSDWSDAAVRRFVARVGADKVDDLLLLRAADTYGKTGERRADPGIRALRRRIQRLVEQQTALTIGDLALDGNDLMRDGGIPAGRDMGTVMRFLLETVIDDPAQNSRETLLKIAQRFYQERIAGPRSEG